MNPISRDAHDHGRIALISSPQLRVGDRSVTHLALIALSVLLLSLFGSRSVHAQTYDILKECMALSGRNADIHVCLDNYLDAMDSRVASLVREVEARGNAQSLSSFQRSQEAFIAFRRTNCLWYLDFSSPRRAAEQLAKSCLARMSGERVAELQRLLEPSNEASTLLSGIYVYGASQNAFRPCGSDARYWVEGRNAAVSKLQQDYLDVATAPLQLLYVTLRGELDESAKTSYELEGVIRLQQVVDVRVPLDTDCRTIETAAAPQAELPDEEPVLDLRIPDSEGVDVDDETPEQELIGYFGAWQARCTLLKALYQCELQVDFEPAGSLTLVRKTDSDTQATLYIPEREIDSLSKIRWQVDDEQLGDIAASNIRVDEQGTRQSFGSDGLAQGDLLARMIDGLRLDIEVVEAVDDVRGDNYGATLKGLTRALSFADDFIAEGAS